MNFDPNMGGPYYSQQAGQMTAEQQHLLNNKFEYHNNQPSKYYRITYQYYPDERQSDKKAGAKSDPAAGQSQRPGSQGSHHYPTF